MVRPNFCIWVLERLGSWCEEWAVCMKMGHPGPAGTLGPRTQSSASTVGLGPLPRCLTIRFDALGRRRPGVYPFLGLSRL